MKISNFELVQTTSSRKYGYLATVDVTTGFLIFKKTTNRRIFSSHGNSWWFSDTSEYTPGQHVEDLVREYEARHGKTLQHINKLGLYYGKV